MLPSLLRYDRPIPPARWRRVFALAVAAAVLAVAQRSPLAPLPHRLDATFAGIAVGMVAFALTLWLVHRRRGLLR